ncbi:MAG: hypothetical protein IPN27_07465 [Cellvibrionales bacterium]|nr:hypothetical protein [Cellvibrionales bacterium]
MAVENLTVRYGTHSVLDAVSLVLATGEIGCCSAWFWHRQIDFMRAVAGFETPVLDALRWRVARSSGDGAAVPASARCRHGVSDHALFPHLTVTGSIAFGFAQGISHAATAALQSCW